MHLRFIIQSLIFTSEMEHEQDIVISGISGRLPECENVEEFWQALFDGVDLLTVDDRRYPPGNKK